MPCSGPSDTATRRTWPSRGIFARGLNPGSGEGLQTVEDKALALFGVLHARLAQVVQDHGREILLPAALLLADRAVHVRIGRGQDAWGERALHGERAGDADGLFVLVGLVVQGFGVGVAGDGRVDLLAAHALLDVRIVGDGFERQRWGTRL